MAGRLGALELGQVTGRLFVGAILQQPGEQEVPRLEQRHILLVVDLGGGQQARGLQIEQSRRYDEELGRLPKVPLAGRAEVSDEFVRDLGEGYLGDIELTAADQAEQQVERAVEVDQRYVKPTVVRLRSETGICRQRFDRDSIFRGQTHSLGYWQCAFAHPDATRTSTSRARCR